MPMVSPRIQGRIIRVRWRFLEDLNTGLGLGYKYQDGYELRVQH